MNPELSGKLISKYPEQFSNYQYVDYIECGDGWYDLLDRLCYAIQSHINYRKKTEEPLQNFQWSEIKEKFGGLRAYFYGADSYINGLVAMAESMSYSICEISGEKGKLRKQKVGENGKPVRAWIRTLSDSEAQKAGYVL
jgi:hypothetical protein